MGDGWGWQLTVDASAVPGLLGGGRPGSGTRRPAQNSVPGVGSGGLAAEMTQCGVEVTRHCFWSFLEF